MMDRRLEVIKATILIAAERGVHDTPMSEIYIKAGVSAGTIYHHFRSKDELLGETYIWIMGKLAAELTGGLGSDYTYQERFTKYWTILFSYFEQNRDEYKYIEYTSRGPILSKEIKEEGNNQLIEVLEFLQAGMFQNVLSPMPVQLMMSIVLNSVMTSLHYIEEQSHINLDQTINIALTSCWKGIKA
jgi:AcrR family transcriptional regulator